ncbi:TonB family protein [Larkinella sp. VNQ87]|uniref:TonB family protein n=1 Tax=Larkinella sp. VNQ87 TaxID=3400921 RepID=UPI003C034093
MNDPNPPKDFLTADDLQRYRAGLLSAPEQHRVERLLLENPLYADALEGLEAIEQQGLPLKQVSTELRGRLQTRIQGESKNRRWPFWLPVATAATVVLALGIGWLVWLPQKPPTEQAMQRPVQSSDAQKPPEKPAPPVELSSPARPVEVPTTPGEPLAARKKTAPPDSLVLSKSERVANAPQGEELFVVSEPATPRPKRVYEQALAAAPAAKLNGRTLSGRVVGENNEPLAGVSVVLKNTPRGTTTDSLGRFQLPEVSKNDVLQLSSVGYLKTEIQPGQQSLDSIRLAPDVKGLAEVVVVGYGAQAKRELTGSVARTKPDNRPHALAPANFLTYLAQNRRTPPQAQGKGISGTVRVRFLVNTDGALSQFKVVKSLGYGYDEEAVRLLREGPRWQPIHRHGKPFAQVVEQDIVF